MHLITPQGDVLQIDDHGIQVKEGTNRNGVGRLDTSFTLRFRRNRDPGAYQLVMSETEALLIGGNLAAQVLQRHVR